MNQEKIGKFIQYLRRERKMTQEELAEVLNVSDKTVSKWERGICLPKMETIGIIINFFGISLSEFYKGEKANKKDKGINANGIEKNIKIIKKKSVIEILLITVLYILLFINIVLINNRCNQ